MTSSTIAGNPSISSAAAVERNVPRKVTGRQITGSLLRAIINPIQLWKAFRLQLNRKAHRHSFDDAQLALYSKVLPTDFLHFGYFENADIKPEDMSLSDVTRAQGRYADQLLEKVGSTALPVLDVGCGMGGLSRMLLDRGFKVVALTPDRLQASHVRATLPGVPVLHCKLEKLKATEHSHEFGTVFTAESLQYLKLDQALPILTEVLAPGGRWVACDFFHIRPSEDRSCHVWDEFTVKLAEAGWRISYQRDITRNVLPTLSYIHMWSTRFGMPLMHFAFLRLRRKAPGLHHLTANALEMLESLANQNISIIDPGVFSAKKRYMLLVMERIEGAATAV